MTCKVQSYNGVAFCGGVDPVLDFRCLLVSDAEAPRSGTSGPTPMKDYPHILRSDVIRS